MREVRFYAPVPEICARLLNPLNLSLHTPAVSFLLEATPNDIHHGIVQSSIEGASLGKVLLVAILEAAMRIEIAAELEEKIKGVPRTRGESRQTSDVGKEFEHTGGKGGRG